jgi:hypothetical protein
MRSAGGTKSGEPSPVTAATKSSIDCFVAPSFHEGSEVPEVAVCADAAGGLRSIPENSGSAPKTDSILRRLTPLISGGDMAGSYWLCVFPKGHP